MKRLNIFICFFFMSISHAEKGVSPETISPLVIIDPGHGGRDHGAVVKAPYCKEKRLALQTALLLDTHLKQLGYKTLLTRSSDLFIPLSRRAEIANKARSCVFVSIHYNSCPTSAPHGIEIHYYNSRKLTEKTTESIKLANSVLSRLITRTKAKNRGLKKSDLYVLRNTTMPAILVEGGFLTNLQERKKLKDRRYLDQIAKSIAEGVDKFLKS